MGIKLCIHANGGYDVVATDASGTEGSMVEYVGYALTPVELDGVAERLAKDGAIVVDFRSAPKLALAHAASAAVAHVRELLAFQNDGMYIEPEVIAKAKTFANEALRRATEESC